MTNDKQQKRPRAKRIKIGAIVEIPLTESPVTPGFAYVQYFYKAEYSGHCIRLFKGIYQERPDNLVALANQIEQLITFYPITNSIAYGFCEVVGWAPVPKRLQKLPLFKMLSSPVLGSPNPSPYKWELMNAETGKFWRVGGKTDDYQKVRVILPEEYHHLPTWAIVPHWGLLDRIELGWTNESILAEDFWEVRKRLPRVQGYLKMRAEERAAKEAAKAARKKKATK